MSRRLIACTLLMFFGGMQAAVAACEHDHGKMCVHKRAHAKHEAGIYDAAMDKMHHEMAIAYTGDPDVDFAKGMVPHHQGAVDMIDILLKRGKDAELREKAEFMKTMQTVEIAQMTHWLDVRGYEPGAGKTMTASAAHPHHGKDASPAAGSAAYVREYQEAMKVMHRDMNVKQTGNADVDFMRGMIAHHQGAIDMARIQLKHGKNPEMNKLAEGIIQSQQWEIAWMERRLTKLDKHTGRNQSVAHTSH